MCAIHKITHPYRYQYYDGMGGFFSVGLLCKLADDKLMGKIAICCDLFAEFGIKKVKFN